MSITRHKRNIYAQKNNFTDEQLLLFLCICKLHARLEKQELLASWWPNWGSLWNTLDHHSTIVSRCLSRAWIGPTLCRETPVSRTPDVFFFCSPTLRRTLHVNFFFVNNCFRAKFSFYRRKYAYRKIFSERQKKCDFSPRDSSLPYSFVANIKLLWHS